ncbi:hypothetical protein ACIRG5_25420 [Lentzea sp. NPDC102401]|uniref:hypothetical protein n=1 Tax=Lentzea sp. NPDC102401 TaxID=3364128 RepID=UPI0038279DDF
MTLGLVAAGEAHAAMRLSAGAGWYWWLVGHKSEGLELILAATETPGEVSGCRSVRRRRVLGGLINEYEPAAA